MRRYSLLFLFFLLVIPITAQEDAPPPIPITSENIRQLQSVMQVDFDDYPEIVSGWFVLSGNGRRIAVRVGLNRMMIWEEGDLVADFIPRNNPDNIVDAVFSPVDQSLVMIDDRGQIAIYAVDFQVQEVYMAYITGGIIQSLWSSPSHFTVLWTEALTYTDNVPTLFSISPVPSLEIKQYVYAPATDPNALVRIGRILPPYVVTSSPEGEVKLWYLETGEVLASADVGDMPAVFGQISPNARFLVWRDPMSQNLSLLDFDTGENQIITALDGAYFQAFFVSDDGSVALGVDEEFESNVVAWIVDTGERVDLGEFRACSRVPDMIRMSQDFTTLVIGCDTGLDIWRIVPEED